MGAQDAVYDAAWEKRLRAVGVAVERLEVARVKGDKQGCQWVEVRLKLDADYGTSVLAVLKRSTEAGAEVGFVGASSVPEVLLAIAGKLQAGAVRWREDRPFGS